MSCVLHKMSVYHSIYAYTLVIYEYTRVYEYIQVSLEQNVR